MVALCYSVTSSPSLIGVRAEMAIAIGNHLLLVGMMGSGRTEVGREIARRTGWSFVDPAPSFIARTQGIAPVPS